VLVDWSVCDAPADCGCLALSPYDPARDHEVSTMASGAGAGGAVVKTTGSSVREIADAAPALANVRDLDCGNESDEKSGHWKVSGPALEANGNEQESDIADGLHLGCSSHYPSIYYLVGIRFQFHLCPSFHAHDPSHRHGRTFRTARGRALGRVASCDRAQPAHEHRLLLRGASLLFSLPRSYGECPLGNPVLRLVSSRGRA